MCICLCAVSARGTAADTVPAECEKSSQSVPFLRYRGRVFRDLFSPPRWGHRCWDWKHRPDGCGPDKNVSTSIRFIPSINSGYYDIWGPLQFESCAVSISGVKVCWIIQFAKQPDASITTNRATSANLWHADNPFRCFKIQPITFRSEAGNAWERQQPVL